MPLCVVCKISSDSCHWSGINYSLLTNFQYKKQQITVLKDGLNQHLCNYNFVSIPDTQMYKLLGLFQLPDYSTWNFVRWIYFRHSRSQTNLSGKESCIGTQIILLQTNRIQFTHEWTRSAQELNEGQVRHWNEHGRNRSIDRLVTHDKVDFTTASVSSHLLVGIGYSQSIEGISFKF